ncbi:MAG: ribonuclease HII [Nanoarchaeota archaeon]|nr:ribonuclease HII [Nanoarchaeota archaeon]MBU1051940.1 ribonuclease HII [Nanoarchaeota archaeon]MBU1988173.1 ribonuclease HII [Nanoarchaeota archaeon]
MLLLGIDDAGRGPIIGPMILSGVLIDKEQEKKLKRHNIRDSKTVLQSERVKLARFIKENSLSHKITKSFPAEIDETLSSEGTNLNTLEAQKAALIINSINIQKYQKEKIKVVVDCPSINTTAWCNTLLGFIKHKDNLEIHCEHKADANHVSVGAASILAKTTREEEVAKIKKQYGPIGSGYPADPDTKEFLKKHGKEFKDSGIFRKTWQTWKKMFPEAGKGQATLDSF